MFAFNVVNTVLLSDEFVSALYNLLLANRGNAFDTVRETLSAAAYDINTVDTEGRSVLLVASEKNSHDIVKELLTRDDVDVNVRKYRTGETVLMAAIQEDWPVRFYIFTTRIIPHKPSCFVVFCVE